MVRYSHNLLLAVSELYVPPFLRRRKLEELFQATAEAFEVAVPSTVCLSFKDCLKLYARFTCEQAERSIRRGDQSAVRARLFLNACRIGAQFRADLHINTAAEVMRMSRLIYKMLGIDFRGEPQGNIVIRSCFFSACYSGRVCRLVSSLDAGLLSGLSGCGRLTFSHRLTEGHDCCRAHLLFPTTVMLEERCLSVKKKMAGTPWVPEASGGEEPPSLVIQCATRNPIFPPSEKGD